MKLFIKYIFIFCFLLVLSACNRIEPEIVEADYKYTPTEPEGEDRGTIQTPPVDLLTQYVYFKNNDQKRDVYVIIDNSSETLLSPGDLEVLVSTSFPVKEPFIAELELMNSEDFPKSYAQVMMEGPKHLPKEAYKIDTNKLSFNVGDKEKKVSIKFDEDVLMALDESHEYVIPLVVKLPKDTKVKTHNYFLLTLRIAKVQKIIESDNNLTLASSLPKNLKQIPYVVASNYNESTLHMLNDGEKDSWNNRWDSWSARSGSDHFLEFSFKQSKVKAVVIYTLNASFSSNYSLKSVSFEVSNTNGFTYIPQGKVTVEKTSERLVVLFNSPVDINRLKMLDFEGMSNDINFHEIEVYTEP